LAGDLDDQLGGNSTFLLKNGKDFFLGIYATCMRDLKDMRYFDNVLSPQVHNRIFEFLQQSGWQFGWKSQVERDTFSFWHKHFAGSMDADHRGVEQYDCAVELSQKAPLLHAFWLYLSRHGPLQHHTLVRCYANGQPFGTDGTVHTDSINPASFTSVYYPCPRWSPSWGGETVLFNKEETDIIACIYPKPNRLFIFNGMLPHVARGVARICPVLRITLMYKTEWSQPATKPSSESTRAMRAIPDANSSRT
jgi:SM-20-related protein